MPQAYNGLEIFITVAGITYTAEQLNVSEMTVTDSDEGDNEIELTMPDNDFRITDSGVFKVGQLMSIQWGYANGKMSQKRNNYVIMKPSTNYDAEGVTAKVCATTKSGTLAARRAQKVSGQTSVKTVISEIANRNGLTLNITGGNERMSGFAYGMWSDREVVRILADRFGYQATYESNSLVFAPRDYGAVPTIELIYARGESSNILTAELEVDAKKSMGDSKTVAISVDPGSKKVVQQTASNPAKSLAISAEDGHSWVTQAASSIGSTLTPTLNSIVQKTTPTALPPDIQKILSSPDPSVDNLASLASGEMQKKQRKKGELTITSLGFPQATARVIVNVTGLAKRDSGNWYTLNVEHKISIDAAYTNKWELSRRGNNTKGTEKNTPPLNNQKPTTSTPNKIAIAISAETGKPLS